MSQFLIFILGFVAGGVVVWFLKKREPLDSARGKKEANKDKIMDFFRTRKTAANDDIQKLLGVSDATATRYLEELEKEGRIRQAGKTGRGVYYTSTSSVQAKR